MIEDAAVQIVVGRKSTRGAADPPFQISSTTTRAAARSGRGSCLWRRGHLAYGYLGSRPSKGTMVTRQSSYGSVRRLRLVRLRRR